MEDTIMTNYAYNFAVIDVVTKMCIQVITDTADIGDYAPDGEMYIDIPTYNEEYLFKYYNEADGKFYYDDTFTQEFIPA
jgi:hypothetical protein